jgi:hypothetical protein
MTLSDTQIGHLTKTDGKPVIPLNSYPTLAYCKKNVSGWSCLYLLTPAVFSFKIGESRISAQSILQATAFQPMARI